MNQTELLLLSVHFLLHLMFVLFLVTFLWYVCKI